MHPSVALGSASGQRGRHGLWWQGRHVQRGSDSEEGQAWREGTAGIERLEKDLTTGPRSEVRRAAVQGGVELSLT